MDKNEKKTPPEIFDDDDDTPMIRRKKEPVKRADVTVEGLLKAAADGLENLRTSKPLVLCMTGGYAAGLTANGLLALGATPAAAEDPSEVTVLAARAAALLINVGALTKPQAEAMRAAVSRANLSGRPWTLDPECIGDLPLRTFLARELMRRYPALIRGNASEILSLAGMEAGNGADAAVDSARRMADMTRAALLVSGESDSIAAIGAPLVKASNGASLMSCAAGMGCLQGAIGAAFLGVMGRQRLEAATAASLVTAIAGEMAAAKAKAPGSFQAAFIDALSEISPADVMSRGKLVVTP